MPPAGMRVELKQPRVRRNPLLSEELKKLELLFNLGVGVMEQTLFRENGLRRHADTTPLQT